MIAWSPLGLMSVVVNRGKYKNYRRASDGIRDGNLGWGLRVVEVDGGWRSGDLARERTYRPSRIHCR